MTVSDQHIEAPGVEAPASKRFKKKNGAMPSHNGN